MGAKYPDYVMLPGRERRVLAAAWLCDVVKVREKGNNAGELVEAILASTGLPKGNPWCAAAQHVVALVSQTWHPKTGAASVRVWRDKGRTSGRAIPVKSAKRGDLLTKDYGNGKGHIGVCVRRLGPLIASIEGNTGSGEAGSQRDGDGMYRRTRLAKFWDVALNGD